MKILSRDFSLTEKILLLVLSAILIFFLYYKLVDEPVRTAENTAKMHIESIQMDLDLLRQKLILMRNRQEDLEKVKNDPNVTIMESYNASKKELDFLNSVLVTTDEYNISIQDAVQSGNQIRRTFNLRYKVADYDLAQEILQRLYNCEMRCLIEDLRFADVDRTDDEEVKENLKAGWVEVSLTATFYETMVGGTPDLGLQKK